MRRRPRARHGARLRRRGRRREELEWRSGGRGGSPSGARLHPGCRRVLPADTCPGTAAGRLGGRLDGYGPAMAGAAPELCEIDLSEVESAVGSRSFERGRASARRGRVATVEWAPDGEALTGSVVGQGALYDTAAFFVGGGGGALDFEDGECTCPVGDKCQHVAAIVIAGTDGNGRAAG